MPDLIMNPHAAVVKANGLPYTTRMKDGWWPLLLSNESAIPARILLEIVWTRLHMRVGGDPEMFGDDLLLERVTRLADYRYVPAAHGWEIELYDKVDASRPAHAEERAWEPLMLDEVEHVLVMWLLKNEALDLDAPPLGAPAEKLGDATRRLATGGLIGSDAGNPAVFRLLTKACGVAVLPDGRVVAGENVSGRLTRWIEKTTSQSPLLVVDAVGAVTNDSPSDDCALVRS
jgi:hypothetical protein